MTLSLVLVLAAAVLTLGAATNKLPLWPAVFVLCVARLLEVLPR